MLSLLLIAALAAPSHSLQGADTSLRARVGAWRAAREHAIVRELTDLLALPNLADDSVNIRRNAAHLAGMLARRGFRARLLETPGSPPAVFGELTVPGATRTVVFYAHYDGQPVDSARWTSPPWRPVLRDGPLPGGREIPYPAAGARFDPEWRLFARSASDDKSPIVAFLTGLDALRALGVAASVNLKVFLEGEEEAGSDHLRDMLTRHAALLRADLWIFGDGPVHQSRRPQISYGVRGVMGAQLTVYGPARPLHSGHYGNWAPNPNVMLAHLIAGLRDEEGRITIPGYLDDVRPPTAAERAAFATIPPVEEQLKGELRLGRTEGSTRLAERLLIPALNVSGIQGGLTGPGSANVIVSRATAYLDFRLVPDQRPDRVRTVVEAHLRRLGWHVVAEAPDSATLRGHPRVVRVEWGEGYPAFRTALDHPAARAVLRAAESALGEPLIQVPTSGGSLPLYQFEEVLRVPLIVVPIVNHDNNQHAENENLRIRNLWDGIELYAGLVARLGRLWGDVM